MQVAPGSLRRALRILDALIKALIARGFSVQAGEENDPRTVVVLGEIEVSIRLEERYRQVEVPPSKTARFPWELRPEKRREPTGELALRITDYEVGHVRKTWSDGKRQRLENCLNAFIVSLARASDAKRRYLMRRKEERREREEERKRREEDRRRRLEDEARIEDLTRQLADWANARTIRDYASALRGAAAERLDDTKRRGLITWIEWVERYADRIDPLHNMEKLVGATGRL